MADGKDRENLGKGRLLPLLIGLPLIAIIAVASVLLSGEGDSNPKSPGQGKESVGKEGRASGGGVHGDAVLGHPALGDADAPVVLVEYSDYQ